MHIAQEILKLMHTNSFSPNKIKRFVITVTTFVILKDLAHTDFLVYQTMAYYQIAVHCILRVFGDNRRHVTVSLECTRTWRSIRH